jgi:hypothetical protein
MDPHTWWALQNQQLAEHRASLSNVRLNTPAGDPIPNCPRCGGSRVRSLDASSYQCENGGECHGYRWSAR